MIKITTCALAVAVLAACGPQEQPKGLLPTQPGVGAEVRWDLYHRPLPEIPLPNDLALRFDASSPTKRRINASMVASTDWESTTRGNIDKIDGWGTYAAISLSFSKPLDVENIYARHHGDDYDSRDDAVYVIDVTPDSPEYCKSVPLDMGEGNFPLTLERTAYFPNDPHNSADQQVFEEFEEDTNNNGILDPGEDLDMDGVLDHPNTRHPNSPRFDIMSFYERETNTLIMKPVMPMRENTTYATVITRRLVDEEGRPVRSPFPYINHASQTEQLKPLERCLGGYGLTMEDVAFTWPFTTQSITRDFKAIRDGLYGMGPMAWLADKYPAEVKEVLPLRDPGPGVNNVYIIPTEQFNAVAAEVLKAFNNGEVTPGTAAIAEAHNNIAFHVIGSFDSPQFFPRDDAEGNRLPIYKQVWDVDPVTGAAPHVRTENITFWVTVPKLRNGPAPVAIIGHGYTGAKIDPIVLGGFFARYGIASIGMECVGHGLPLSKIDREIIRGLFAQRGVRGFFDAASRGRAEDLDHDGTWDSGSDFWTGHLFHTRDVVRQSAIDYMRLIQVLRSFDGKKEWKFDVNKDGKHELAGDWDADGQVDFGANAGYNMTGGSLGGIMSTIVGGAEPAIDVSMPVSGGGGLVDIGVRSIQGGVPQGVNLLMMGPLLVTQRNPDTQKLDVWQWVSNYNKEGTLRLAPLGIEPKEGDTAIARNLRSGEYRCGRVLAGGMLRAAVSSDDGDPLQLEVYAGALPPRTPEGCEVPEGVAPIAKINTIAYEVKFRGKEYAPGTPLIAYAEGFGLRRNHPELRRFLGLSQLILDPADPVNFAPNFENRLLKYGNGEEVRTRALVVNTIGDMNVPMATGTSIARAAGFIDIYKKDERYGKTPNRVLIDTGAVEAVERTGRYQNSQGQNVLMDLEDVASIAGKTNVWDAPKLNPPLRLMKESEKVGGFTGALFPMDSATGRHGFSMPDPSKAFDIGTFMFNIAGRYMQTKGAELHINDGCALDTSCAWIPPKMQ
ncbi:MAG: hypothetical protein K1X64_21510 [Myxococcaceae bacterium]|nr:hypothetical protein [Myxococcaceae bacterium]